MMKTDPDFTWEWITDLSQAGITMVQQEKGWESLSEGAKRTIQSRQGIIAIVPKLRAHPALEKLIPYLAVGSLGWFPAEDYEIWLNHDGMTYNILILKLSSSYLRVGEPVEEKTIAFDDVADEIYAYITKLRDD